jgi:hypothetical protein
MSCSSPPLSPNAIDLTDVCQVTSYLQLNAGAAIVTQQAATYDDELIQSMITGLSQHWLTQTSRASLNTLEDITEIYDGNGSYHIYTDNWPINSVASCLINNYAIPFSNNVTQYGLFIERQGKSIAIRPGGAGGGQAIAVGFGPSNPATFWKGIGNVVLSYNYGYDGVPFDVQEAVTWQVAQAYRRREHIEKKSIAMGGGAGTTTYYDWEWSPDVMRILNSYKRVPVR